jgi:hypothetical protein
MWWEQRVQPPAPGHSSLETMTQQDYAPNTITFNTADTKEIARFTEDGFYYKGEFIDDAGEVHRLLKEVLGQMKVEQNLYTCATKYEL